MPDFPFDRPSPPVFAERRRRHGKEIRMPANFVHNRFLQFSARPLLLGHCCSCARVLRSPRSDDGHRVESPGSTPSSMMIVIRGGSSSWERQVYPS